MGPGTISERVGQNIRRYRTERGMTQEQLAEQLTAGGMPLSDAAVSRLEAGRRAVTVDHLMAVAEVLDVAPSELLEVPAPPAESVRRERTELGVRAAMPPGMLDLLAGLVLATPETAATLERAMAVASTDMARRMDQQLRPLLDAMSGPTPLPAPDVRE